VGAKFIVDRRCPVKTSLTLTGLIEAIKHRGLLRRIGELAAGGVLPAYDPDARLDMLLPPEAGLPGGMTVRELQTQASSLLAHAVTCRMCPSSLNGHVGGCIAYVPYPLSDGMEYLLWSTAVKGLKGELPEAMLPAVRTFAEKAAQLKQTPFATGMRARGDLASEKPRSHQTGSLLKRVRLSSAQVLDLFFLGGVLGGDDLRVRAGYLEAVLAVGRAMADRVTDPEQRQALIEDTQPYGDVRDLMVAALDQGLGVYVWP